MYQVRVKNGRNRTYNYRKELGTFGLAFSPKTKCYEICVNAAHDIDELKQFCKKNKLKIVISDTKYQRNSKYRENYLSSHEEKKYWCAYCGNRFEKEQITIDHIFPVDKTSKSVSLQNRMHRFGIGDINSEKNLVPACKSCNSKKASKTGRWIIKGFLGKSKVLWVLRRTLRCVAVSIAFAIVILFLI